MNDKQLPTLQPGDSHMESLIEAAIQGHASTHDAMRWLVRQLVPAKQPAEVTDAEIEALFGKCGGHWSGDQWVIEDADLHPFVRTILALRPVQVPMTEKQIGECIDEVMLTSSYGTHHFGWAIELARAIEAHHGITAQADLWCIHIPGPDEAHAAPSKEDADHMAAKHNAAMAYYYASGAPNLEFAPPLESVQAVVIKWPHDQQSHADELREFDYASWGITAQAKKEGV